MSARTRTSPRTRIARAVCAGAPAMQTHSNTQTALWTLCVHKPINSCAMRKMSAASSGIALLRVQKDPLVHALVPAHELAAPLQSRRSHSQRPAARASAYHDGQNVPAVFTKTALIFKSEPMADASFATGGANAGKAGELTASTKGIWYMFDQRGNLAMQGYAGSSTDSTFTQNEKPTHYYYLPNEFGDILIAFDQGDQSYAVYSDHLNTPRLVTLINNPLNPVPASDTSNDLPATGSEQIQGISPKALPVWQMPYSAFGVDLANNYQSKPLTIQNNFKPELWEWVGLPSTGGAADNNPNSWSWWAGGGNAIAAGTAVSAPVLNHRFPGQYWDYESGLMQNWYRSYSAQQGGFTQMDPIGLKAGPNRRIYAHHDGINYFDKTGLIVGVDDLIIFGGGAIIGACIISPETRHSLTNITMSAIDGVKKATNWWDLTSEEAAENRRYHEICDQKNPHPPQTCEWAKFEKNTALACRDARKKWMDKWGKNDPVHEGQLCQVDNRLKNAEKLIDKYCKEECTNG